MGIEKDQMANSFNAILKILVADERVFDIAYCTLREIIGTRILRGFTGGSAEPKKSWCS